MPLDLYSLHDQVSGRTLTIQVEGETARLRIDAPGLAAMSIPVSALDLTEAAGALSSWTLEHDLDE